MATKKTKKTTDKKSSRVATPRRRVARSQKQQNAAIAEVVSPAQVSWATFITSELAIIIAGIAAFVILVAGGYFWYTYSATHTSGVIGSEHSESSASDTHDEVVKDLGPVPALKIYAGKERGALTAQLAAKLKKKPEEITVRILLFDGTHASGQYSLVADEQESEYRDLESNFYAVVYNNAWSIVYANDSNPSCNLLRQYSFPADMSYDCSKDIAVNDWSQTVEDVLVQTLDAKYAGEEDYAGVMVQSIDGDYARGIVEMFEGYSRYFFAKKAADRWEIIHDDAEPFDCKAIAQKGVPQVQFGSYCYQEYELIRPQN